MSDDSILNTAVIGCGGHARQHFGMIADEPRLHLVAAADIDATRLEQAKTQHRPDRTFADYREMLDQCDLDLVYVVTMPGHLLPIVLDCMARHLHVSVEKSPGMTSAETEQMATAGRESRGKAIVSFNRRYLPEVLAVRRLVLERGGAVHCAATYNKTISRLGTAAMAGVTWPFVEAGIALSIAVLGGLIGVRVRMPVAFSMALVGGFALFHGLAHGLAAPAVPGAGYGFGFVAATAMLHGAGLGIGLAVIGKNTIGENTGLSGRWAGAGGGAIVATGLALMVL